MIVKRIKFIIKKVNEREDYWNKYWDNQKIKITSYWLMGIIPIYISKEIVNDVYEK